MTMRENGLAKLVEELGELQQVAGKFIQYPNLQRNLDHLHPDGCTNIAKLEAEIADVSAALDFVIFKLALRIDRIEKQRDEKLRRFMAWDRE